MLDDAYATIWVEAYDSRIASILKDFKALDNKEGFIAACRRAAIPISDEESFLRCYWDKKPKSMPPNPKRPYRRQE